MIPLMPVICWRIEKIRHTTNALVEFDFKDELETVLALEFTSISSYCNLA